MRFGQKEHEFLRNYIWGHSHLEIQEEFNRTFDKDISTEQVKAYIKNNHLNTGRTGHFKKGNVPHNKGKKGICFSGCEKTWFKTGNIPKNYKPVGSERINSYGYVEVKIGDPNKWKLKHRLVWEKENGEIPKNRIIIFKDGNKENTDINNLMLITRSENAILNKSGMYAYKSDFKETAVLLADITLSKKRR